EPAKRETDTQDGFACSSWYYLRYVDPLNDKAPFDRKKSDYWLPVDLYMGGAEHAVMHLLYSRFYAKVMYDAGLVGFNEPFKKLLNQGMILGIDHQKMSKSKGNVVNPDDVIKQYGADTLRMYILFMGPFDQDAIWSIETINGTHRFIKKLWTLFASVTEKRKTEKVVLPEEKEINAIQDKMIQKITDQLENYKFNTTVSSFMEWLNFLNKSVREIPDIIKTNAFTETMETFIKMLAPIAPHITDELWSKLGHGESVHLEQWPEAKGIYKEEQVSIVLEVNGKVRDIIEIEKDADEQTVKEIALNREKIKKIISEGTIKKIIYIKNKLFNVVLKK
ncbi:MAG: class I tRNA ligase family protein, partial [Caldisericaceae bacterium]|nr:class I tRNA ligase family protein [Caldisericaceae bacterium]